MRRPSAPVRVFILVAAVACLGLAMCAHSQQPAPAANTAQVPQAQAAQPPDAAPAPPPPPKPTYFNATKAPGGLYR